MNEPRTRTFLVRAQITPTSFGESRTISFEFDIQGPFNRRAMALATNHVRIASDLTCSVSLLGWSEIEDDE